MTALLLASWYGHLPVVRELVDVYKVNVFHKDKVSILFMSIVQSHCHTRNVDCSMYGMYVVVSVYVILCGQGSCCKL